MYGWFLVDVPTLLLCLTLSDDRSLSVHPLVVAPLLLICIKLNSLSTVLNLKIFIFIKMPEISLLKGLSLCPNPGVSSSSPGASSHCTSCMSLFYLTGSVQVRCEVDFKGYSAILGEIPSRSRCVCMWQFRGVKWLRRYKLQVIYKAFEFDRSVKYYNWYVWWCCRVLRLRINTFCQMKWTSADIPFSGSRELWTLSIGSSWSSLLASWWPESGV